MKILTRKSQNEVLDRMLHLINMTHMTLEQLNEDFKFEFGESILYKKIGETKFDEKFYRTLRDQIGSILGHQISEGFNLVRELGLNSNEFRDKLDEIFYGSEIYNGEFDSWVGIYSDNNSMKLDVGKKDWWSRKD